MSNSVFCTATASETETIVRNLRAGGFSGKDISVLMADQGQSKDFALENSTKAPEGAAAGAGTGAVVGGTLGWLVGIGALAIPGVGPFIAAGPILAALGGAALGGTVGGLTGALVGMGIPELEAKKYESKVKSGSSFISVQSNNPDETQRAKEIFESAGAQDINTAGEDSLESRDEAVDAELTLVDDRGPVTAASRL